MALKKLNRRHKEFIRNYIKSKNASESARQAGYKPSNSDNTGYLLLHDPLIKGIISQKFIEKDISIERIIAEYVDILEAKDAEYRDKRGVLQDLSKIKGLMKDKDITINNNFEKRTDRIAERRNIFEDDSIISDN